MRRGLVPLALLILMLVSVACGSAAKSTSGSSFELGAKSAPPQTSKAFTIVSKQPSDAEGRKRLVAKIVVDPKLDSDHTIEAIRGAVQELLPADGDVQAVEVFVYHTEAETSGDWTVGHGFAAKDGKGWDGSGTFPGKVFDRSNLELDMKLSSGQDHFSLAR